MQHLQSTSGRTSAVHHDLSVYMPFSSETTFWICTGIILFFVILDRSGWTVRTICTRIFSILRGAIASGRPWWYRHHTESPRDWTGLESLCQVKTIVTLLRITTGMPVTVHDTIVCNDRHAIREGRLFS